MMQKVQLSMTDAAYATALRESLCRSCAWHIELVKSPDLEQSGVLVLDEFAFAQLPLPLANPERIVVICQPDPQLFAQAWDAGIVSVLSKDDAVNTILLAIMAAGLRVARTHTGAAVGSGISPSTASISAPIAPSHPSSRSKHLKLP